MTLSIMEYSLSGVLNADGYHRYLCISNLTHLLITSFARPTLGQMLLDKIDNLSSSSYSVR